MRDIALDKFKFVLIALVIIGHVIEPVVGRFAWVKSVYIFIYLFHMPMFAYVSGVVSSREIDTKVIEGIVRKLIIPYIFLELAYSIFDYYVFSRSSLKFTPLIPYWILWYMFSLAMWRILLPIFNEFKFPIVMAVIAGLACGINKYDYNLSFSRTFVFFPFFLIGHYYHLAIMDKVRETSKIRIFSIGLIIAFVIVVFTVPEVGNINFGWLYGSRSYSSLDVDWQTGIVYRSSLYIAAFILGIAFLSIADKVHSYTSSYGKNSLYIYVLHGFVMKTLIAVGFYKLLDDDYKVAILMVGSLILLPILSSKVSKIVGRTLMNPLDGLSRYGVYNFFLAKKPMSSSERSPHR